MPEKYNSDGDKHCNNCEAYHHPSAFGTHNNASDLLDYSCRASINEKRSPALKPAEQIVIPAMSEEELMNLKLISRYEYTRPDAYDIYINNINSARK